MAAMGQAEMRAALQGFVVAATVLVEALSCEPDAYSVRATQQVAQALGCEGAVEPLHNADLNQRYHERFFVPTSAYYVPLAESCIRGGAEEGEVFRYGSFGGAHTEHVLACYGEVEFDWKGVRTADVGAAPLRADSMACELAFMAALAQAALDAMDGADQAVALTSLRLLKRFWSEHAGRWFERAFQCVRRSEDDYYALVCDLAARTGLFIEELSAA